jgi:hypothetical protein
VLVAPLLLIGSYYVAVLLNTGIGWSVHLWTGVVFLSGLAGWLLSYSVLPPALPEGE